MTTARRQFQLIGSALLAVTLTAAWACAQVPDVELAAAANSVIVMSAERADAVILTVTRDGQLFFLGSRVDPRTLTERLKDVLMNRFDKTVLVRADAHARYQIIGLAFKQIRDAGVDVVDLLTSIGSSQQHPGATATGLEVLIPPSRPPTVPASSQQVRRSQGGSVPSVSLPGPIRPPTKIPTGTGAKDPIVIQVLQGPGGVQWKINRMEFSNLDDLTARLRRILEPRPEKIVFAKMDERLTFKELVDAIDAVYAAGAEKVAMMVPGSE